MRINTLLAPIIAFVFAAAATNHAVTDRQSDTKANDILGAVQRAIGGTKVAAMKTFSAEAKVQRNVGTVQMNSDVELVLELPDKYARTDAFSAPLNTERTTGFNGDQPLASTGGMAMAAGGAMVIRMGPGGASMPPGEKPTPEQQAQMNTMALRSARAELSRLMLGWFGMAHPSIGAAYSYAGQAESPDGKADVIEVKGADGFAARLFIDQQSHLPLVVTYQGPQPRIITNRGPMASGEAEKQMRDAETQPPAMVEMKLFFSDWSDADGIKFPHKIQRSTGNTPDEEWTFTKVKVNPKVDPKKFQTK